MIEKRLAEISARKLEIRGTLQNGEGNLDEIQTELEKLEVEETQLRSKRDLADKINVGEVEARKIEKPENKEERKMEFNKDNIISAPEYRSAFLNNIRKVELTEVEQRAMTTAANSVGAAVPETTQNRILQAINQYAPLLAEVEVLRVPGGVKIPVEGVVAAAAKHTEGATITASDDTITYVDLFGYEITKLLTISKSVQKMSINAFENWLVNNLSKSLAKQITGLIISGSGTGEATGIDKITWDTDNSITVAVSTATTAKNIQDLISLLPGGYDPGAKFLMSKKTLFQDIMPLQDSSKHQLVTKEGANYFIYGYPVMLEERITLHEAILGNFFEGYKANMPEEVNVTSAFDLKTNSFDYLGAGMFDGKVAMEVAFVKLVKATA